MTTNKGLRVFAVAALGLGLFSANTFALPVDEATVSHAVFQIRGRVEDSILVRGLSDVEIDFDNKSPQGNYVEESQFFTIKRRGATEDAPGFFSITANSQYGGHGSHNDYHVTKNQRGDVLPVVLSYWDEDGGEYLRHGEPVSKLTTTGKENEHKLKVSFDKYHIADANPGLYNANVTLTIAAE